MDIDHAEPKKSLALRQPDSLIGSFRAVIERPS
jgi:hypothetical protein